MKNIKLRAASNTSWLEATQLLIRAAQQKNENVRSLTIREDITGADGKFRLKAKLK